jgi:hypothetical protein
MQVIFRGTRRHVSQKLYGNRRLALVIASGDPKENDCIATANFPGVEEQLAPGEFLVLNDGKEEGALAALQDVDIARTVGRTITTPSGRTAHVCVPGAKYEPPQE